MTDVCENRADEGLKGTRWFRNVAFFFTGTFYFYSDIPVNGEPVVPRVDQKRKTIKCKNVPFQSLMNYVFIPGNSEL